MKDNNEYEPKDTSTFVQMMKNLFCKQQFHIPMDNFHDIETEIL